MHGLDMQVSGYICNKEIKTPGLDPARDIRLTRNPPAIVPG